jgi:ATP-dependent Clp protease ATP-binding subunit ClpA
MFERFTNEARQVVTGAVREAESRDDSRVGTEHLLLGIFDSGWAHLSVLETLGLTRRLLVEALDEFDGAALAAVGIDPGSIDPEVLASPLPNLRRRRHIPFTGAAKNVLKGALEEAIELGHKHIGVEHIVLALTALPSHDRTTRVLKAANVEPTQIRSTLLTSLRQAS